MGIPLNELNRVLDLGFKPQPWGDNGFLPANYHLLRPESPANAKAVGTSSTSSPTSQPPNPDSNTHDSDPSSSSQPITLYAPPAPPPAQPPAPGETITQADLSLLKEICEFSKEVLPPLLETKALMDAHIQESREDRALGGQP